MRKTSRAWGGEVVDFINEGYSVEVFLRCAHCRDYWLVQKAEDRRYWAVLFSWEGRNDFEETARHDSMEFRSVWAAILRSGAPWSLTPVLDKVETGGREIDRWRDASYDIEPIKDLRDWPRLVFNFTVW